jgi:hypothetical protein
LKKKVLAIVFLFWLILLFITPTVTASSFFDRTYEGKGIGKAFSVIQTNDYGYAIIGYTQNASDHTSVCWLVTTNSDGVMEWNRAYDAGSAYSILQTGDGGYILAGDTIALGAGDSDFWLVKTDSLGNIEWNQTYGGPYSESVHSMVQTSDGGYVLVGETESFDAEFSDFLLVKTDTYGNMEWNKTYDATGSRDYAPYVIQTDDSGYALVGRTQSSIAEGYDIWVIKTDSVGAVEWNQTYRVVGNSYPNSIVQTGDGGYAIAGCPGYWFVKTDLSGKMEWNKTYMLSQAGDWCNCMIQAQDGSYLLGGVKSANLMVLIKTDSSGNLQWNQTYGNGAINSVIQTSDGGYALAGYKIEGFPIVCLIKTDEVGIIPEFQSWTPLLVILIAVVALAVFYKRRLAKYQEMIEE